MHHDENHRQRMALRRARQLVRVPGFDARPSRKVRNSALRHLARLKDLFQGDELQKEVARAVARGLPMRPLERRARAPKPSRSDNPAYRKPVLARTQTYDTCRA